MTEQTEARATGGFCLLVFGFTESCENSKQKPKQVQKPGAPVTKQRVQKQKPNCAQKPARALARGRAAARLHACAQWCRASELCSGLRACRRRREQARDAHAGRVRQRCGIEARAVVRSSSRKPAITRRDAQAAAACTCKRWLTLKREHVPEP